MNSSLLFHSNKSVSFPFNRAGLITARKSTPIVRTFTVINWPVQDMEDRYQDMITQALRAACANEKIQFVFNLDVLDVHTVKYLFKVFRVIHQLYLYGKKVEVKWISPVSGNDEIQTGLDFEAFCEFPFQFQLK